MRIHTLIALGILATLLGCNDQPLSAPGSAGGDWKYREVAALPDGIDVIHTPAKVYAEEGGRSGYRYTWLHETSVKSTVGDLTIIEFGGFSNVQGEWVFGNHTGEPFTPEDFAEWYSCPDSRLVGGQAYTDPQNWTGSETLRSNTQLWYFIGEDPDGNRFKGLGQVRTLAALKSEEMAASQ